MTRRAPIRRRLALVAAALLLVQVSVELVGPAQDGAPPSVLTPLQFIGPGGADAVGPGPVELRGFVRVIDGDTLDVNIRGHRVAVGLLGVKAPQGNTPCGQLATRALMALTRGGLRFDDDPTLTFDARKRRMYRAVTLDGRQIAEQLARDGVALGDGRGERGPDVLNAELDARAAGRGCAWRGVPAPEQQPGGKPTRLVSDLAPLMRGVGDAIAAFDPVQLIAPTAALAAPAAATTLPAGFSQDVIASGLNLPTAMTFLPDGRILVAQKQGVVRIIKNGTLLTTPFIDISNRVNDYFDRGLLGMAADPNFATNGHVWLLYTYEDNPFAYTSEKAGRLSRVTAVGDTASPASEVAILGTVTGGSCNDHPLGADCIPNDNLSHTEGNIKFAADGSIFLTLGDGASFSTVDTDALRAQNLDSLAGKVIHILPNGLAAPENPFHNGDPTANRSKIWAYGVRNSFRFNIRPSNGSLYVGDVGWNAIEEVNVIPPAANLGWPCYEGPFVQTGYQSFPICQALYAAGTARPPLISYTHSGGSSAVTGGPFYSGTVYPAQYQGAYFYADYGQSFIRTLRLDANDNVISGPTNFATDADGPVDMEVGLDQNIYYIAINTGELRRIRFAGNAPPTAVASVSPNNGLAPLTVSFSSAGSSDAENEVLSYSWNFGDGTPPSTLPNPSHTYTANGTYTATLTVSDPNGSGTATARVVVGNLAPTATITSPAGTLRYKVGDVIAFSGSGTDPEDGAIPPARLAWQVIVHHCPAASCHSHYLLTAAGSNGQFTVPDHGDESHLELQLTAADSIGLTGSASVTILPQTSQVTLQSSPASLRVTYDGATSAAPLIRTSVVGSSHSVDTTSPQGNSTFASWSDGGAQHHNIVVPATDATYTATFNLATSTSLALSGLGYAEAPHNPELNTTGDWTVEAWFKDETPFGYNHGEKYILMKGNTDGSGEMNYIVGIAWNRLFVGERTAWTNDFVTVDLVGTTANAWHHVAATMVASTRQLTIYLDGVQAAQGTLTALSPTGNGMPLEIGRNGSGNGPWIGKIDDVRIWNLARSAAAINANFRNELGDIPGGLVGNWKFDEGSGTTAADTTAIAEHATLFGTTTWSPDVGNGPPPPPPPTTISSVAASFVTNNSAVITWVTNNAASSEVDYGTTTAYGSSTIEDPTLLVEHSQQLTGLVASTLYHYRVHSVDAGGTAVTSGDFTFTTGAPDTTPPVISAVSASGITNSAATITWTTSEPADGQVEYGTTTSYGSSTPLNPAMLTSHSQALSGLAPSTLYHYRIKGKDAAGNPATSGDFSFSTTNTPPLNSLWLNGSSSAEAPHATELNVTGDWTVEAWFKDENPVGGFNHDFAYLTMKGNTDANSEAPYVLGIQWNNLFAGGRTGWTTYTTQFQLTGVNPALWHHAAASFVAATRQITLYLDGVQVAQSTLGARSTTGNGLPVQIGRNGSGANAWRGKIDDVRIWNVARSAAEISGNFRSEFPSAPASLVGNWKFNEGSGTTALDSGATPQNATLLTGATWSTDVGNNPPAADTTPPTISAVSASAISTTTATIGWTTSENADSQVEYGTTTAYGTSTTLDPALVISHSQPLSGLVANTQYHYRVKSKDAAGNLATSLDFTFTSAAADTTPPVISAVAATLITTTGATIGWTTNEASDSEVEYGTTTAYGASTTLNPALVTSHSQPLSGLVANTQYHYRVKSTDGAGNLATSLDFTFTTAAADTTPPVISGVSASGITNIAATITWTTSEAADGQVDYGTTTSYGTTTTLNPALVTGHSQALSGLVANTLYHYRVRSKDAAGNPATSVDFTFSTTNTPPLNSLALTTGGYAEAPSATELNVTGDWTVEAWFKDENPVGSFNHDFAYIAMKGNTDANSEAPYVLGIQWNNLFAGGRTGWTTYTTQFQLTGVNPALWHHAAASFVAATRQITLYLDGVQVAQGVLPARSTTGNGLPVQIGRNGSGNNPWRGKIDDVRVWNVARTGAEIGANYRSELGSAPASLVGNWKFNEGSGTTALDSGATPQNAVLLGGAGWSPDVGNTPAAPDTTPPAISSVSAGSITSASASISWTTDEAADSQVEYGTTTAYGSSTTLNPALVSSHIQGLSGLAANTTYHYRVKSRDGAGNLQTSIDFTFATAAPDTTPPVISAVSATGVTNVAATIGWTTNEPADTQVEYGTTTSYGSSTTLNPALVTSHSQALSGLVASTTYHYRVLSKDAAGNAQSSGDLTFTTTNTPPLSSLALTPGGYAEIPNATELNITGDWTIEAWFRDENAVGTFNHDFAYIVMKGNTNANPEAPFVLGIQWNNLFAGSRTGWSNYSLQVSLVGVNPAVWHHAAASFVAATRQITLYLDGVQVAQGTLAARSTAGNALPVQIGRNGSGSNPWRGKIDDVRIWNVVRTAAQISTSYQSEIASAPAALVGNWKFNEGSGTTALDSGATPQNAALLGGAGWSSDVHP